MSHAPLPGLPHVDARTPLVLALTGPVTPDRVAVLCDAVGEALRCGGAGVVVCDVGDLDVGLGGYGGPALAVVDLLCRLQLAARREGGRVRLRGPAPGLRELLALVGVSFEVEGEPEEQEPALGVQEAVQPVDPSLRDLQRLHRPG